MANERLPGQRPRGTARLPSTTLNNRDPKRPEAPTTSHSTVDMQVILSVQELTRFSGSLRVGNHSPSGNTR